MNKKEPRKDYKDAELNKLKKHNKRLLSENNRLKSELRAYESAFKKTTKFLKDHTDDISLEKLIKAAKDDKSLKKIEEENVNNLCPKCSGDLKQLQKSSVGTIIVCAKCNYRSLRKNEDKRSD